MATSEIFLDFTRRTGHEHPHLEVVSANYRGLLQAMGKSDAEIEVVVAMPLSPEEGAVLDGFETFRSEHPIRFASLAEEEDR